MKHTMMTIFKIYLVLYLLMVAVGVIGGFFSPNFIPLFIIAAFPWDAFWVPKSESNLMPYLLGCIVLNIALLAKLSTYFWQESKQQPRVDSLV